ncbi:MAG: O-antigen ligase family protein [Elusimicrobia bacterium]|nr:O-antigen ligase family protein [Elusimicrobiota bacterium]
MKPLSSNAVEGIFYALTAFAPFAFGCVEPWSRAVLQILCLLLALACFLRGRPAPSRAAAYAWLVPAGVATLGFFQRFNAVSAEAPRPLAPFTVAPHETGLAVMAWVSYAAILGSVPRVVGSPAAARRYMRFLFGLGVALAVLGLLQGATGGDKLYWIRSAPRTSFFGPYYNRNHAANVLLMSLGAGIGLLLARLRARGAAGSPRPIAAGLLVLLAGLAACASQAAFLAVPLAGAAVALIAAPFARDAARRRGRALAALAAGSLVVALAYGHVASGANAGALVEKSVMARLFIYGDAWRWWRDAPLFGTGLGSFETVYPSYHDMGLLGYVTHAHSDWIEFALEAGLFGLIGALTCAAAAAVIVGRTWREARSAEMRALIGGGLAAAAAFAAHAAFEFCFQIPANAAIFCGLLGFLLSAPAWADKASAGVKVEAPSRVAMIVAAAYALSLAWAAALPAVASWRAGAGPSPSAIVQAVELDASPRLYHRLAAELYRAAAQETSSDVALMRVALGYALAAVELRPFDCDALYLAGAALRRLGRQSDGDILLAQAQTVRFARLDPRRQAAKP